MITTSQIIKTINDTPARSAWMRGVKKYAVEIAANVGEVVGDWQNYTSYELETIALNGATDWAQYSEGGCALVYNSDICERLATPSQIKRTRHGELDPNAHQSWIDVQTRALMQAWKLVIFILDYKVLPAF